MKAYFTMSLMLLCTITVNAQLTKLMHKTIDIDSAETIVIDLVDDYEIESWPGNLIMTELTITMKNGSKAVLDHFLEAGRYDIDTEFVDNHLKLFSKDSIRQPIKTKSGKEYYEEIFLRIYLPDAFVKENDNSWTIPKPDPEAAEIKLDSLIQDSLPPTPLKTFGNSGSN